MDQDMHREMKFPEPDSAENKVPGAHSSREEIDEHCDRVNVRKHRHAVSPHTGRGY